MFRLSKKVEYGILSLQYLADREGMTVPVKEIAVNLTLSFEFLSKTMQILMKKNLIHSQQGIKGGYTLSKPAKNISLNDIVYALDSSPKLVECMEHGEGHENCERLESCSIRSPLVTIQQKIDELFQNTTLADLKTIKTEFINIDTIYKK
jgi:Rrf2 family protein